MKEIGESDMAARIIKTAVSAVLCALLVSCGGKKTETAVRAPHEKGTSVAAEPGDAYLAIADSDWKVQYWGKNDDADTEGLAYDAGVVQLTEDGIYTVSVTADTDGFRKFASRVMNDENFTPNGVDFMAVMIRDGEKLYPDSVIIIKEIKADGKTIPMISKAYTSSDDGIETRANILNKWVIKPTDDARCSGGSLYDTEGKPRNICSQYSSVIVSPEDFGEWKTIEVKFHISGVSQKKK